MVKKSNNRQENMEKDRDQIFNPKTGLWTKVNTVTGKFMNTKTTGGPFKDIVEKDQTKK